MVHHVEINRALPYEMSVLNRELTIINALPEDPPVVFSNEFRREETEQCHDSNSECQPVETCIEWNAQYRTGEWQNRTHNSFIEQIRKEQEEEQSAYCAEKERLTPERYTPIKQ